MPTARPTQPRTGWWRNSTGPSANWPPLWIPTAARCNLPAVPQGPVTTHAKNFQAAVNILGDHRVSGKTAAQRFPVRPGTTRHALVDVPELIVSAAHKDFQPAVVVAG